MRGGRIKRGKSKLASNHFLCDHLSLDPSELFTELHREEKREEGDRGDQEEKVQFSSVAQLCLTLYDPMNCSLPGSSIHGIFQVRILERVAISSSGDLPDPGIESRSPEL